MSDSRPLIRHEFGHDDPLQGLGLSRASQYVRRYLNDLDCRVVIEEPVYFDHDYLAISFAKPSRPSGWHPT
jgi:hypothetical protein